MAAERKLGDACSILPAAPQVGCVWGHHSVGPAAPSNPVANIQCNDKKRKVLSARWLGAHQ